ncbi:MAG TPA: PDR/VanB family oxidoreductase [Solirubrobacterales bacterium]|nr:PDR/VanB family oxidoreductase [Solirubrobacterales bacterium]
MAGLPSWMVDPAPAPGGETIEMRVAAKRQLSEGVVALELVPPEGEDAPVWEPGAHVDLHLPKGMARQYSLCGDPADRDALLVAVLREEEGRGGSRHLHDVTAVGDLLPVGGPRNNFALEPSPRYLFIGGGIGITPLVPMIAAARASGSEWSLLYGGRTRGSMAFLDELSADPRVTVVPEDERGMLDLAGALAEVLPETLIYCCGPEPLLHAVEETSAHWGAEALRLERFKARDDLPTDPGTAFEVVLDRSGLSLTVQPGQSILDAVAAAGVAVPSSCQEGTCGTCETLVLEGEPEHRDSVLTPADRARNDCMMICISRARSERLVLDL